MKTFFGGNFIKEEMLSEAGIYHPIKLEYYKRINEDEILKENKAKFGICIIKTEYKTKEKIIEEKEIKYLTNDEKRALSSLRISISNYTTKEELDLFLKSFDKNYKKLILK